MKILQIVHGFPPESIAGTERYCEAVSRHLLERGHECIVLAGSERRGAPQATLETVEKDGLLVTRYLPLEGRSSRWTEEYDPKAEGLVRHLLAAVRPDLVHLHHWLYLTNNLVAICTTLGIPVIVTLHDAWTSCPRIHRVRGSGEFCPDPIATAPCPTCAERGPWQGDEEIVRALTLRREILNAELALADVVIVPSEAHRRFIMMVLDLPEDRLIVLSHGVLPMLKVHQDKKGGQRFPQRPLQIGHWGYLLDLKGTHLILEAVHRLRDPSTVEVHLIGEAPDPEYTARLRDLAQGIAVQFHGSYQPADLESFDLDLAVFPSIASESYSFTLSEALGLGLPVVVPNRGAFQERIGEAGLIFEAGQAEDLARVLQQILDAPDLIETMRMRIRSELLCTMETHLAILEKIYKDTVQVNTQRTREVASPSLKLLISMQQQVQALEATLEEREAALGALQGSLSRVEEAMKEGEERLQQNHDLLQQNHDLLQQNHDLLQQNHDLLQQNHDLLQKDHDLLQKDHDLLQKDHEALADFVRHLRQTPLVRFQEWLQELIGRS